MSQQSVGEEKTPRASLASACEGFGAQVVFEDSTHPLSLVID